MSGEIGADLLRGDGYSLPFTVELRACLVAVLLHGLGLWWWLHTFVYPAPVVSFSMTLAPMSASVHAVMQAAQAPAQEEVPAVRQIQPVVGKGVKQPNAHVPVKKGTTATALPSLLQQPVIAAVKPARYDAAYLHNPAPQYPPQARRRGEEGTVWVRVLVNAQGEAQEVLLKRSSGYDGLDDAALTAVEAWHFSPAETGGQFLASWVEVPLTFRLEAL